MTTWRGGGARPVAVCASGCEEVADRLGNLGLIVAAAATRLQRTTDPTKRRELEVMIAAAGRRVASLNRELKPCGVCTGCQGAVPVRPAGVRGWLRSWWRSSTP